jgi:bacillopeptidase F (M6 metalloprotease family)
MARKKLFWGIVILGIFFLSFSTASAQIIETVFSENWESGPGNWDVSNGVWQVGAPTAGPGGAHGGSQCAGTVLDGNYPNNTDSRLISPSIRLSQVSGDEEIHLRFWHWFSFARGDAGYVQISVYDEEAEEWSAWDNINGAITHYSAAWSLKAVDITAYADQKVRIAFYHVADGYYTDSGWYIDDIAVIKIEPEFTGDFEGGWGDWSADNGVWEVGTPAAGPGSAHGGEKCAGTVLDANYPNNTDSRLISPSIRLPQVSGDEEIHLRFWHWFSYPDDSGYVQISVFDEVAEEWSAWDDIYGPILEVSAVWTPKKLPLTAYAGQKVKIAFYHTADGYYTSAGWYIDDIRLPGVFLIPCEGDFDNDGDVDGSDLAVFAADFGRTDCSLQDFCYGDFDGDCDVDGSDLAIFAADFGRTDCFNVTP